MIKALFKGDGEPLVLLGLSRMNTEKLHEGCPILVKLKEMDPTLPDLSFCIIAGETEDDMKAELERHMHIPPEIVKDER